VSSLYRDEAIVLRTQKLGEADRIVTLLTRENGRVRAAAKGVRKTMSRFGARLEPFMLIDVQLYVGRSLDTVTQADILGSHRCMREDLGLFGAGETMLEAVDKVAEEHERNVRLFLLLLTGLRALDARPLDPTAVTESFLLKLLSLSGFHPSLRACAICGSTSADRWSSGQGGAVCAGCADLDSEPAPPGTLELLATLATSDLAEAGDHVAEDRVRRQSRAFLFGFCEYHLERRMRSFPIVARSLTP